MRDGYERSYRTVASDYDYRRALIPSNLDGLSILSAAVPKEPKMEEPKNIAIKILVEKLKAEQASLASNESSLKSYENGAKNYREAKGKNQRAIKDLAAALKKLGHKDA